MATINDNIINKRFCICANFRGNRALENFTEKMIHGLDKFSIIKKGYIACLCLKSFVKWNKWLRSGNQFQ